MSWMISLLLVATLGAPASPSDARSLVDEILIASGVDSIPERARLVAAFEEVLDDLADELRSRRPTYRRARRAHRLLHDRYLERYDEGADGIQQILDDGRYNCLSATLFYGIAMRELGYRPEVVEIPGHVFLRLSIGERTVEIETTARRGFDVRRVMRGFGNTVPPEDDDLRWLRLAAAVETGTAETSSWTVPLERAVGFAWLNSAWRHLSEGRSLRAAESVLRAAGHLPDLAERAQGAERLLAQAFSEDYEAGRFGRAYRTGEIGVFLSSTTTTRDRLYAATLKRIEQLCEKDRPGEAWSLLQRVGAMDVPAVERARLERGTTPLIAVAAVRLGQFDLARTASRRYSLVERDRVESRRLERWVEQRGRSRVCMESDSSAPLLLAPLD